MSVGLLNMTARRWVGALALTALAGAAQAQQAPNVSYPPAPTYPTGYFPAIGTQTQVQFEYDGVGTAGGKPTHDLSFNAQQQTLLEWSDELWFSNLLTMNQLTPPNVGTTSALQSEGLYAEELYGRWTNQVFGLQVGKFSQNFGRAWYLMPGVSGEDFVSDYQLAEMWGAQASYMLTLPEWGQHKLSISDFEADRTPLSNSLFYLRGRLTLADGGPANTPAPESVVISYDGSNVPVFGAQLSYQFSYADLGRGQGDTGQERRLGAGFNLNIPIATDVASTLKGGFTGLRLIGEYVNRTDSDGVAGQTQNYYTGGLEFVRGNWVYDLSTTFRDTRYLNQTTRDRLVTGTVAYNFPGGFQAAAAIAGERQSGVNSLWAGLTLSYVYTQCDRCSIASRHY